MRFCQKWVSWAPVFHKQCLASLKKICGYTENVALGTSLMVQWLRLCASNAGAMGLMSGWGTNIPNGKWHGQILKYICIYIYIYAYTYIYMYIYIHTHIYFQRKHDFETVEEKNQETKKSVLYSRNGTYMSILDLKTGIGDQTPKIPSYLPSFSYTCLPRRRKVCGYRLHWERGGTEKIRENEREMVGVFAKNIMLITFQRK